MGQSTNTQLIQKTPDVVGGNARIRNTRIPVWMLVQSRRLGLTDEEIRTRFGVPLSAEDVAAAWRYYADHTDEIDRAIRENEED